MLNLTKTAGAKIVVQDPFVPPLIEEYAIDLPPNAATSISVQTVKERATQGQRGKLGHSNSLNQNILALLFSIFFPSSVQYILFIFITEKS